MVVHNMDHHISEEHGGVSIEGEDHDPMEDDNHAPENTFEDDGMNALINDTFGTSFFVVANDDDDYDEDDIEIIHDIPLLEKENMTLYEGSQSNLLSFVLLLVSLKVMNSLPNITMSCILRFVIYIIIVYKR